MAMPDDQAEIVFSDVFVEQLADLTKVEQLDVLAEVNRLCEQPAGKHPLGGALAGWNTVEVNGRMRRVVYKARTQDGAGTIHVLCVGKRSDDAVYDTARALVDSGLLTEEEATQIWDALALVDVEAEAVGLDGWDYRPPAAPEGMQKAAVAAGVVDAETAAVMSKPELEAAMENAWTPTGEPDPEAAVAAALRSRQGRVPPEPGTVLRERATERCNVVMPVARARCIRRKGHPGPHRASP